MEIAMLKSLVVFLFLLGSGAGAQDWSLDTSFGNAGRQTLPFDAVRFI
jgi:hypothetical protein